VPLSCEVRIDDSLRIRLFDRDLGRGREAFRALDRQVGKIVARVADSEWTIAAGAEVPHGAVIRAMDSIRRAGIDEITFVGAPPPVLGR
jgi:biopolymer transport protein ExbD